MIKTYPRRTVSKYTNTSSNNFTPKQIKLMKNVLLASFLSLCTSGGLYAQLPEAVIIGKEALYKLLPEVVNSEWPRVLTAAEIEILAKDYRINYKAGDNLVY